MLDALSISTPSGLVLWSKSYHSSSGDTSEPINSLVQEVLLSSDNYVASSFSTGEGVGDASAAAALASSSSAAAGGSANRHDKDSQSMMWTLANDLGLIFVVVWPRILHLGYLERLLDTMKQLFVSMYGDTVRKLTSGQLRELGSATGKTAWSALWAGWDGIVTRLVRELEAEAAKSSRSGKGAGMGRAAHPGSLTGGLPLSPISSSGGPPTLSDEDASTTPTVSPLKANDAETIAKNIAALKARNKARLSPSPRGMGKKGGKGGVSSASEASDTEGTPKRSATPSKVARKWEDSNKVSDKDMASLDFSSGPPPDGDDADGDDVTLESLVDTAALGQRQENGLYEVADYQDKRKAGRSGDDDDEEDSILAALAAGKLSTKDAASEGSSKKAGALSSFFSRLSTSAGLSSKAIAAEDLVPVMNVMREHLMNKNVARDIADKICDSVSASLVGKQVSGFGDGGVRAAVRKALEESLTRILTSKTSTDILLDVNRKKQAQAAFARKDPYAITFVGVNGVGKSTNLSKVAFWLLQNRLRVLIAACDTFRSGAVEQLRIHVRNLGKLKILKDLEQDTGKSRIELYERGYGKDAAGIAKDAIAFAKENEFDVVLIDTAGRMQDNEPLMRALAKLVSVNNPDKILFVGEAVVGNEAVDQLTKFNRSLRDFSGLSNAKARGVDGMILTKMDVIDDKVGAALSMTYVTSQPIVFIGTGQTYTDLKAMKVNHVVNALLRN